MKKHEMIMGPHAICEVLKNSPSRIKHVFTQKQKQKDKVIDLCQKHKIPVSFKSFEELSKMVDSESHQSFVGQIHPRQYVGLKDFLSRDREKSLVLMLDQIFDPQNFGALLRSAECFGVDAVVFSKNRGSDITPVVTKTSCGASEILPLVRVANLAESVTEFQENGYEVVASVLSEDAKDLASFSFSEKTVLVVGSEGEGIQKLIQKRADHKVYINMLGNIESLNVAQATSTLLYAATLERD